MSVEAKIKKHIFDKGMKYSYVAEKTGINNGWLNKSLNGKRRLSANELVSVCMFLNLDIKDFANTDASEPA